MSDTDTTITALLEELRGVDFETWKDIKFLLSNMTLWPAPNKPPLEQNAYQDIIQGCIQRAVAAHRWDFQAGKFKSIPLYSAMIWISPGPDGIGARGESPAAAILVAYVQAKRASR